MSDRMIIERRSPPAAPRLSLLANCWVEKGDVADWDLLHELHYKAEEKPFGAKFYRCVLGAEVIGVGVMSSNKMLLRGRNLVFPNLKPGAGDTKLMNQARIGFLNKYSTVNSRLVLDTMYRGAGIAYRMQNLMMRLTGRRVIEFQSSMSKFNPFAAKAGIRFSAPYRSTHYEAGIAWFRRWFAANPADVVGVLEEYARMNEPSQVKCLSEMREFYYRHSAQEKTGAQAKNGTTKVDAMPVSEVLKKLQQLVLASPLYGVYFNPDFGRELPERLPLLAFDAQPTDQPLILT